jgi:hypothetical protein
MPRLLFMEERPGPHHRGNRTQLKDGCDIADISACAGAWVESSVAAPLSATDASKAMKNIPSACGQCQVQASATPPSQRNGHWVSTTAPAPNRGSEAALMIQATYAGEVSRNRRLFTMGKNDVSTVAANANRSAMHHSLFQSAQADFVAARRLGAISIARVFPHARAGH